MDLSKLINYYSLWKHQNTIGSLSISVEIEVKWFTQISLILEAKFGDNPEQMYKPRSWYWADTVLSVVQKQWQVVLLYL